MKTPHLDDRIVPPDTPERRKHGGGSGQLPDLQARKPELLPLLPSTAPDGSPQPVLSTTKGASRLRHGGADPWPHELPTIGPRGRTTFVPCVLCGVGSWVTYGALVLCLDCARSAATPLRLRYRDALYRFWTLTALGDRA